MPLLQNLPPPEDFSGSFDKIIQNLPPKERRLRGKKEDFSQPIDESLKNQSPNNS